MSQHNHNQNQNQNQSNGMGAMMQQAMSAMGGTDGLVDFIDNQQTRDIAYLLALHEQQHIEAIRSLEETAGVENPAEVPDAEQRAEDLVEKFKALIGYNHREHYLEEVVGVRNPSTAVSYCGLEREKWEATKARWVADLREQGNEEYGEEVLAEKAVRDNFGVKLSLFESEVIEWDDDKDSQVIIDMIAGPSSGNTARVERVEQRWPDSQSDE